VTRRTNSEASRQAGTGWTDIMQGGMTPKAAAKKAFKRVEKIFSKYPIE
jgi:rubredoxin